MFYIRYSFQNDIMIQVVTAVPLLITNFRAFYVCSKIKQQTNFLAFLDVCVYVCVYICIHNDNLEIFF